MRYLGTEEVGILTVKYLRGRSGVESLSYVRETDFLDLQRVVSLCLILNILQHTVTVDDLSDAAKTKAMAELTGQTPTHIQFIRCTPQPVFPMPTWRILTRGRASYRKARTA